MKHLKRFNESVMFWTKNKLEKFLTQNGVDLTNWGTGQSKTSRR